MPETMTNLLSRIKAIFTPKKPVKRSHREEIAYNHGYDDYPVCTLDDNPYRKGTTLGASWEAGYKAREWLEYQW